MLNLFLHSSNQGMETDANSDSKLMVEVLSQAEELTKQLEAHLDEQHASEQCKSCAQKIQSCIRTAICMATEGPRQLPCHNSAGSDSPRSNSESPRSEKSDGVFKDVERREMYKKRKSLPKWTNQVRVSSGSGFEVPLDDGYCWRKYGQKDILGAKHPRAYYRCTHRNAQGCLATKQVQRSDQDWSTFDVTYRGAHTCQQIPRLLPIQQNKHKPPTVQDQQLLLSFGTGLQIKTKGLESKDQSPASSSFSPSLALNNHLMGNFSPTFTSTTTSGSNYFSFSQCQMTNYCGGQSDLAGIVSAATSTVNSPIADMDFVLEELNTNFPFDSPNFLP